MKAVELDKTYNPKDFEDRLYKFWEENGYFKPAGDDDKEPFTIVIPPPNVTGVLHMGHGLNNSLQDILIRYNRMLGKPTLWVPGTDHAGIATQNVVERQLKTKGLSRHDLGREKFLEETWKVKDKHHSIITDQLKKIGASCDWSRERFTLDDGLSKAVKKVFVELYNKGLIYKGEYLVNWCPSCGTALADDEVDHEEKPGTLYHYTYPLSDGSGVIEIATTRPETMFGDSAVAVHPDDERYTHLHGKTVDLPLTDRKIPIIVDSFCKMEFGTGAVKITPAHDPNDWDIGNRHDLEKINVLNPDGTLNDKVPEPFRGMDVVTARKATVEALKEAGVYMGEEDQPHQVGHCYRCKTVVEPYMSEQWFVKMAPLAEKALKAWEDGEIHFYPKKWENTYKHWLDGIRDWCISRQLWWGHRIPVWYCQDCGEMIVSESDVKTCTKCGSSKLEQETDVLDTWFSSWLWPFSTLGWPEDSEDLAKFYPTSALVTAYDIIFFWVARMIMAGLEFTGKVPFRDIYIHQLIRAKDGRKMSKSLGNGIDPLDVVDEYGSDAMKFTLAYLSAQGQDILMDMETVKIGSKFCNKVWNASRYILMNLEGRTMLDKDTIEKKAIDQWIYHRLNETVKTVSAAMAAYRFDDMGHAVYEYFWNDFCDWYVEASKLYLYDKNDNEKDRAVTMLIAVLEESLKLLHPFIPFLTEEIYQKLPGAGEAIIVERYPEISEDRENPAVEQSFEMMKDIIQNVRTVRSEFTIPPAKKIRVKVKVSHEQKAFMNSEKAVIATLIKSDDFEIIPNDEIPEGAVASVGKGFEAFVFIRDAIDMDQEIAKIRKNIEKAEKNRISTEKKLANEKFVSRAPVEVIDKEKEKLEEFTSAIAKMEAHLAELVG